MKTSIMTKFICALLCVCMILPLFASCSGKRDDPAVTPGGSGGDTPGGDTPGGDTPGGDTETTYYKVSFAVALEEYKSRVTLPQEKLYKAGTEIQYLPTPAVRDMLFMGWYYDAAMTRPVALTDKVNGDLVLYAKVVDTSGDIAVIEGVYYHTVYDVEANYIFSLKADNIEQVTGHLSIVNISSAGEPLVYGEDYTVTKSGEGIFDVAVSYKPGKTYRAGVEADQGVSFVVDGIELSAQVTTLNVLVAKEEVANLQLSDGLIYIPKAEVNMLTDTPNGLVSISDSGASVNSGSVGYFTYDGAVLKSGDKVAVYEGEIPSARDFGTDNGAVKYLTVTSVKGNNTYEYRISDTKEVLFIPDIIPVSGKTNPEREAQIAISSLDFTSNLYTQLGMDEDTVIEIGDYIAFFDGPMTADTPVEYVKITGVYRDNQYYYIDYVPTTYDDVIASMDLYHTRTNTPDLSDAQLEEIKEQVYAETINSGFVEEAADYLVNLYVSTNGLETMPNGTELRYNSRMPKYANAGRSGVYYEITKCEAVPDVKVGEGVLKHFEDSNGIRVELTLSFEIEFTVGEEGKNKVVISAEAVFEEEILLSINVEGGAVWETAWVFPYIADYEMNANIDIGTYTGVSAIAKVYTNNGEEKEEEEEDDDSFFPDFDFDKIGEGDSYEDKAKNIGEELKKLFELNDNIKEEIEGEGEEDDTGNDITEKYAEMMKDASEAWIEIVRVEIYKQSLNLDQFGILWFEIGIDFVVSAQLYIMAGIEVETGVAKRYNFSVLLFERTVKTEVIDLEKAHFSFKFYVMGTAGLKVGFEVELSLALLSSDVASVGISAELGVSLGIWGYFYFSYEKEAGEEPEIQKAGAMFFEIGIYVEVKFKAHLFNIEKLTYNPTLYENFWPIYSVGTQENVFEFEDYEDRELSFTMQGTNSIVLPDYIFRMKYLDLKDGKYYSGKDSGDETPSKSFDDDTESKFLIEISDSRFSYDPKTNTLSTTVDVQNMNVNDSFEIKIQLTYKHGALAFNQEVITREITVKVTNNADYGYIYVWLDGPATLGANGPGGSHTYAIKHGESFTVDMLPKYNVYKGYKFVKWVWMQNYRDVNDKLWVEGDDFVGIDSVERKTRVYVVAVWEPQIVENSIRIYKETAGGAYVYDRTETISGLAGSEYNLYKLADPGYTVNREKTRINYYHFAYGKVCDLYLEREIKTIRYNNVDGEGGVITTNAKSGSALVPPVLTSRLGYEFAGWADASNPHAVCEMPETVPYVSKDVIVYTALWTPVSDVAYTVKHYVQNANDNGYELYMTEYFTGYNEQALIPHDFVRDDLWDEGYGWIPQDNPGYKDTVKIALDGSTVIRLYYHRRNYYVNDRYSLHGYYCHGQTVDLTTFENIPRREGYRFAGWDYDGDGIKDDSFIMPKESVTLACLWEGVDGTEYKVIHMVQDTFSGNYTQAGFSYLYGVTGSTPAVESIYDSKYMVEGQFVPNYDKAKVYPITYGSLKVMYAYYDRVEHDIIIRANDPETGELVKEVTVKYLYGKTIYDKYFPSISEFDIEGYKASRYGSSGYTIMPDHDIVVNVVYTSGNSTPFIVNHYLERTDGTFYLYRTTTASGKTGLALHNYYRSYRLTEFDGKDSHFSLSTTMLEEAYVARDGSTVYDLYYVRDKVNLSGYIYQLDINGKVLDKVYIHGYYRYGEKVVFSGYYDNYEFDRMENKTTDTVTSYDNLTIEEDTVVYVYFKPKSGVPYTVTHWIENVEGTGYEIYATHHYKGDHSKVVSADRYVLYMSSFPVDAEHNETIVLDASAENNLNIYYNRRIYEVKFSNSNIVGGTVIHEVPYGAPMPTPPENVEIPGYDFIEWKNYTAGATVSSHVEFQAIYTLASNTPYKVNHYVMDIEGNYQLMASENHSGYTNSTVKAEAHLHPDYTGSGYTLSENSSITIAPDGSSVLSIYYDRASFRFSYHYYVGGTIVNSMGEMVMHGAPIPDSIYDYVSEYPEYELESYEVLQNGEYVSISQLPATMSVGNMEIRVILKAIGPDVTIVHKVMNVDGETYEEVRETFIALPFVELDLTQHLLASAREGFTPRFPVSDPIPDALSENVYEIYYDRNTYTVEYVNSYNLQSITESYLFGASIGESPVFIRPGYTQSGWNRTIPETMPAGNITFTSEWQIRESVPVTIIHMMSALDGEGYVEKLRETVYATPELMIYGSNYAAYIPGGTYRSADRKIVETDGSTEICLYYSRNEYTVRFSYGDIAGAGEDVVLVLPYETELTVPNFQVPGYELIGWSPDTPTVVPANHVTYTARWQAAGVDITVNHMVENLDGTGYELANSEILSAQTGAILNGASYQKEPLGFSFDSADKNVTVSADGGTTLNVYYKRNSYTLTFTYGEMTGEAAEHIVKYGAALPAAPVFSVVGYTFSGWDKELAATMPASNLTYVAEWEANNDTAFIVEHYYQNAGDDNYTKVESETKHGTTASAVNGADYQKALANAIFERAESKVIAADGSTVIKVYYKRTTHTITFTYGDKAGENATYTLRYGQTVSYNPSFSAEGYVFAGWDKQIPAVMPGSDVVINAIWNAADGVQYKVEHYLQNANDDDYTLDHTDNRSGVTGTVIDGTALATMVGNGIVLKSAESKAIAADGSTVIKIYYDRVSYTVTYTYGNKVGEAVVATVRYGADLPAAPVFTVLGYTFAGWDNDLAATMPASNLTYNATWTANTDTEFTVEHYYQNANDDGYTRVESEIKHGTTDSTVNGASFKKDTTGFSFANADSNVLVSADGSAVVKVYYTRNSYKVTYTYGSQAGEAVEHTVKYGAQLPTAPVFTVAGYVFAGWNSDIASTMPASNLTYVAQWVADDNTAFTVLHYYQNAGDDGYTLVESETKYGTTGATVGGADYKKTLAEAIFERAESKSVSADGSTVIKVYYVRTTYTLTFTYGNKVGENATYTLRYGQTVSYNPSFSVVGYVFDGWDAEIPATMPAENITLNATWTAGDGVTYVVEHYVQNANNNEYTLDHTDNRTGVTGTVIDGTALATLIGNGIVLRDAESKAIAADGSTVIKIYYDRASYTVTYTYGNKVGESISHTVRYGAILPEAPVFNVLGYTFAGWDSDVASTMPASNLTYNATWTANSDTAFTVEHYYQNANDDGYTKVETEVKYGTTDATVNGRDYKKALEEAIFERAESKTVSADGSTVIKVYYTRTVYTLTFTYGNKVGESISHTVRYGATLPEAPVFNVLGYTFAGWDSDVASTMPASNLTYNATWTANTDTAFTVEHYYQNANDDGYTKVETEVKYGTTDATVNGRDYKKALAEAIFERAESKTVSADGSTIIKVYYTRTSYTLTFTYGNKVGENATYTLRYGQTVSYNPSFSVVGYVFAGWDAEIPFTMPAQNVTINATWTASNVGYVVEHYVQNADNDDYTLDYSENRVGVTGTVIDGAALATLVGNGIVLGSAETKEIAADGSTVIKIYYNRASYTLTFTFGQLSGTPVVMTLRYGASVPETPKFTAVGYTFAGWDSDVASTMPASNLTYNATWTANTDTEFTVEHYYQNADDDGYTKVDSETMQGTTASTVNGADYKKEFDEAIYEKADVATILADGSTVIKVYYKRTTYTLTFSYDYVSQDEEVYTLRYGATLPTAPVFSAPGYIFNGWYDEEGCYVDEFAATMPASNLIYKAIWMERDDTKFTVEHYIEQANGYGYDLVDTAYGEGRTNSMIDDYWQFVLYDDGVMYVFERFNSEELVINPDGSTVLKIYYQRVRYVVNFIVVDEAGNEVNGVDSITAEVKYGQTLTPPDVEVLEGYIFVGFDSEHDVMPDCEIEYYIVWRCIHECNDGTHQCEKCGEPLDCADHNDDGHCDYGREPMDPDDHRYVDEDEDHVCDICFGSFFDLCFDNDKNGICDICGQPTVCPVTGEDHKDEDEMSDHLCDDCGVWMSYMCVINDGKHECKVCYARFYDMCTDADGDCWCDECIEPVPCTDEDGDGFCDVCENLIPCDKHVDEDQNALCDRCVENLQWCDEYDDMHRDENMDHLCDYCGLWLSYNCSDWTDDGRCEDCYRPAYCMQELGKNHADGDGDHYCDECSCWMSYVCTDADGDWYCDECGNELKCFDHVDENQDAACDLCGEETKCKANPGATYHEDSGEDHICDWCGVWVSIWCIDDDYDGYCDESGCDREFVCNHVDEDEDNCCDRCSRIINCTHESVSMHICDTCNQKVTDCYSEDGDLFCDECWEEIECHHEGTMDAHVCTQCYAYLTGCNDEDGDGECDLSEYFPHSVQ